MNLQNLVFRTIEYSASGKGLGFAEASAMKLYAARAATEVAMEAVQIYGGNGYMSEYEISRAWRDTRLLTIGGGASEVMKEIITKMSGI